MRRLTAIALVSLLVACGGGDSAGPINVPSILGMRVVYTANTNNPGRPTELWVTDTAGTAQSPTMVAGTVGGVTQRLDQPFVSAGDGYFGARFAAYNNVGDGCPASMTIITSATGVVSSGYPLSGNGCLHELKFNPPGNALAMRFSFPSATGANLATTTTSAFPGTLVTVDTNSMVQTGSTVQRFRWSVDGNTPTWTEAGGLYSSLGSGTGATANLRSTDVPVDYRVGQIAGVPYAVYIAPGETRFRITNLAPLAAQSQTYLTNALAPGDTHGAFKLSPDGAHLLYEVRISGAWQLWLVSLAAPLAEQRADTSAPLIGSSRETSGAGSSKTVYGFNPDNTRFVWSGDVGGGSVRLNTATVAAPTVATILTPATEAPYLHLLWSDANTVVYGEWAFGLPSPLPHVIGLRTVSISAPLVTAQLYNAAVSNSDTLLYDADICSDGTVVYMTANTVFDTNGNSWAFNGLFAVHPSNPGGLHPITPWYGNFNSAPSGIGEFDCE